jgi:hypothetical protein
MTRVTVQCGFGYAPTALDIQWTDITGRVKIGGGGSINITRGAEDEMSETQTGTMSLLVDNADGALTPGLSSSPYYPNVKRNCPIRVVTTVLGGINYLEHPGLEVMDNGWDPGSLAPDLATIDTEHVKSGSFAYKVGWTNSGTGGVMQVPLYGLTIGVPYTASVYVWVPAGDPAVRLDIDGTTIGTASTLTGTWQRISVSWTTTSAAHTLRITTNTTSPTIGAVVWMDEAQVEQGSSATAWSSTAATHHHRFYGMVTSWPMQWGGLHSTVALTASDIFKLLARRPQLGPMLVEEVISDGAVAYYPLSEPEASTTAGDQSGSAYPSLAIVQAGVGGTLTFGQGIGPPSDGLSTPVFTPASATAGKYLHTDLMIRGLTTDGSTGEPASGGTQMFECWFSTSTSGRIMLTWSDNQPAAFEQSIRFGLESGTGKLRIVERFLGSDTATVVATPNLADGATHHLVWVEGGAWVYVDGVLYAAAASTFFNLRLLSVGGYKGTDLWSGTISHVAAYVAHDGIPSVADIVEHYTAGTTGHSGEDSWERIARLASYTDVPLVLPSGDFSAVASQGELGSTVMSHMRDVERTEGGKLFCDRGSSALRFQSRSVRYNPVPELELEFADLETDEAQFTDDDQKLINLVVASRPGGATQRVQDDESIAAYGPYQQTLDVLKVTDAEVLDAAHWTVIRYADPLPEMRQVPVIASTLGTATYRALLDADISTVFTVTDLPDESPAPTVSVVVEGYTESISENVHALNFHTSRSDTDSVWVLDDPTYSVLNSTTRLAY